MLTVYDIIYFIIYIICLIASFKDSTRSIYGVLYLRLMLFCGFVTEIAVSIFKFYKINDNKPYYFYIPLEYCLLMLFYVANTQRIFLKNALYASIVLYLTICLVLALLHPHFIIYPSLIYNLSCLLNTVWVTFLFLDLVSVEDLPITSLSLFWIYTSFLIFYAGIFFFNGVYNYFLEEDSDLAKQLRNLINTGLNYVLYSTLTYGFICSKNIKRY